MDVAPEQGKSLASKKAAYLVIKAGDFNSNASVNILNKTQDENTVFDNDIDKGNERCNLVKGSYSGIIVTI